MSRDKIKLFYGDVRNKQIATPNHFISHMIEHIAWRMGLAIDVRWDNDNWKELGKCLGAEISNFTSNIVETTALGMIDDGSAIVTVNLEEQGVILSAVNNIDLDWFLSLRCEQVDTGKPLILLLEGIGEGLGAGITIQIWSLEDPHHTWEGIYRGLGIALGKIFMPEDLRQEVISKMTKDYSIERDDRISEISILEKGVHNATVRRGTAETGITITVDLLSREKDQFKIEVDESIRGSLRHIEKLMSCFTRALDASVQIDFKAISLSSSHVVMEDIGLVLGRALLEIVKFRMEKYGVNGAGSSIIGPIDIEQKNVQVGVSVEGRKFWRLIPKDGDSSTFRRKFLIGQEVLEGLRSEDLDDFIDGLAGGMSASIMILVEEYSSPDHTWQQIYSALGTALQEVFLANPYRRGVPPGVKATLA